MLPARREEMEKTEKAFGVDEVKNKIIKFELENGVTYVTYKKEKGFGQDDCKYQTLIVTVTDQLSLRLYSLLLRPKLGVWTPSLYCRISTHTTFTPKSHSCLPLFSPELHVQIIE